ncbi:MAG: DUF3313 domain-containing protein [Gammaproteobacteria bacterium]|nr:DUF3313 domain-containing protein [Gammaproteobacteria bacterium]MDH3749626.1 DUF3313 domain-containing protein [Gammaproteobacteria bacterium]
MLTPDHPTCKSDTRSAWSIRAFVFVSMALSGCTTVETQSFNVPQDTKVEAAYIASNADFSKYDRLHAEDMGIFFPQNSYTPPEDTQRIRQIFRNAFLSELQGYAIVDTAGPTTMTVQATLIDFRDPGEGSLMSVREELRDIASKGELLFLMELSDSESGTVLARAADSAQTPTFATAEGVTTDWSSVEAAAQNWAALFRQFLDQNLGH